MIRFHVQIDFSSEQNGCKIVIAKMADFTQHAVFFDLKYVVRRVPDNSEYLPPTVFVRVQISI